MSNGLRRCGKCQTWCRVLQQGLCGSCYVAGRRDGSVQLVELSSTKEAVADRLDEFREALGTMSIAAAGRHVGVSKRTAARYANRIRQETEDGAGSGERGLDQPAEGG